MELTELSIEQMNEVIALFDGWIVSKKGKTKIFLKGTDYYFNVELKYHTSWDWLHPVWDKYQSLVFPEETTMKIHLNYLARLAQDIAYGTINEFHEKLYKAIQWYNQQINKPD